MRRALALSAAALLALGGVAAGNGRPPLTNGITFKPGDAHSVYLRTTFGLLISHDDCTFRWVCETNVGYAGKFDPKYAIAADGTIFATTYQGLRVSRDDGCSFTTATSTLALDDPARIADAWVDSIDLASDGAVWVTTVTTGKPNDVYRSTDNGVTFVPQGLHSTTIWWKTVRAAPSDPNRIYVTGYEVGAAPPGGGQPVPIAHLMRSDDHGAHWSESALANVDLGPTATLYLMAVSPTDPDVLFVRSEGAVNTAGDALYRSTDGGATFQKVLASATTIEDLLIVDANRVLVALGPSGTFASSDGGATFAKQGAWQDAESRPPALMCLGKRGDELFGCGANWKPDYKALAHSSDGGKTWQKQLRFVEIAGPVDCPAGTAEHDTCVNDWSGSGGLQSQFGTTGPVCGGSAAPPDAGTGSGSGSATDPGKRSGGCCDVGTAAAATTIPGMAVVVFALRRRRKRACCS